MQTKNLTGKQLNKLMENKFEMTCCFDKKHKYYEHFGINEKSASLYGNKPEEIINVKFKISENQIVKSFEEDTKSSDYDYWGWYDFKEKMFSFIWHKRFLLEMCFPNMKASEENKRGKAYRLDIIT